MEVEINGKVFELQKPSGYRLLKVVDGEKDSADLARDLILACVKSPELTKEEVESMDSETFFTLSTKINDILADELKKLEALTKSNRK